MASWRLALRQLSFKALVPFYALLRLTIPLVDPGTYSQQWLVVAMLCRQVLNCKHAHACGMCQHLCLQSSKSTSRRSLQHPVCLIPQLHAPFTACSPLGVLLYFSVFTIPLIITALVAGVVLAGITHGLTRDEERELPPLDCGTGFSFGPAVFSLLGFFMGVLWIDSLASEVRQSLK
jgi:sodium/potassium/calcium exchanger 6